ncbi:MAG: hypothetical protein ACQESG_07515 [Nanobdellota archaeon]
MDEHIKYQGQGINPEKATKDALATARQEGYKGDPLQLNYQVGIYHDGATYKGDFHERFEVAYAAAVENTGVSVKDVQNNSITVTAEAVFQRKLKPGGSRPCGSNTSDITDLF